VAHEITEQDTMFWLAQDGVPWHGLGKPLYDAPRTAEEAIVAAGLNWEVEKRPLSYSLQHDSKEDRREASVMAVVRKDLQTEVGICKRSFHPLQNREAFGFFDEIAGKGGLEYRVAGSLRGGAIIWILVTLPKFLKVGEEDALVPYLLLSNSHDGSQAVRLQQSLIRVVCANTMSAAHQVADLKEGKIDPTYGQGGEILPNRQRIEQQQVLMRIYHTKDVLRKVKLSADFLSEIREEYEQTQVLYNKMAQTQLTADQIEWWLNELEPDPEPPKAPARREAARERLRGYFQTGPGAELETSKNTAWGLYNAATYYIDHQRGRLTDQSRDRQDRALASAWFGAGQTYKEKALELCSAFL
jgi:hypothetical protein